MKAQYIDIVFYNDIKNVYFILYLNCLFFFYFLQLGNKNDLNWTLNGRGCLLLQTKPKKKQLHFPSLFFILLDVQSFLTLPLVIIFFYNGYIVMFRTSPSSTHSSYCDESWFRRSVIYKLCYDSINNVYVDCCIVIG